MVCRLRMAIVALGTPILGIVMPKTGMQTTARMGSSGWKRKPGLLYSDLRVSDDTRPARRFGVQKRRQFFGRAGDDLPAVAREVLFHLR